MVKPHLYKNTKISQALWWVPVIPGTQEAGVGESLEPLLSCMGDRVRLHLKNKKNAQWSTLEAEAGWSFEPMSWTAAVSYDCTSALQPGQQSKILSLKNEKEKRNVKTDIAGVYSKGIYHRNSLSGLGAIPVYSHNICLSPPLKPLPHPANFSLYF